MAMALELVSEWLSALESVSRLEWVSVSRRLLYRLR
jgi:hypothetical protein